MLTRIDHATLITWQGTTPVVLRDSSITYAQGMITFVGPTPPSVDNAPASPTSALNVGDLRGRPLGRILLAVGRVTREQVDQALQVQQQRHGIIGQTLVHLGYVTDPEVEWALAVQAGRDPGPLPPPVAVDGDRRPRLADRTRPDQHASSSVSVADPRVCRRSRTRRCSSG